MLKKLKALFVVEEEGDKKNDENVKANSKDQQSASSESSGSSEEANLDIPIPTDLKGKPDPKFVDVLLKAIEKNNLDGFDYLEYKQSLQSLQNMEMDEGTRYKSAFAMAKTMGATPKNLMSSANHYLKVLQEEEKKFREALANQRTKQIKGRVQKINSIETSLKQKKAQIDRLNKEIKDSEQELKTIKDQINKSAAKVESTNERFHLAYNLVTGQIKEDVSKMKSHLA